MIINNKNSLECKTSIHSIAPYVGKMRPALADFLVKKYTKINEFVIDPFCGSGTIPFEAWRNGRSTCAIDYNQYAYLITLAKLFPPESLKHCLDRLELLRKESQGISSTQLPVVPGWVADFFHPQTLKEILVWVDTAIIYKEWFILACLMGILHHQRPGFLSYPASNGAPYLRSQKFPRSDYPHLYEYRSVYNRLKNKIHRVYKNLPVLDYSVDRRVYNTSTLDFDWHIFNQDTAIITSPPYMKSLTYARDNRLRLWFLGCENWAEIDKATSYQGDAFLKFMRQCFVQWAKFQNSGCKCILVIGNIIFGRKNTVFLPDEIRKIAEEEGYMLSESISDPIPDERRVQKKKSAISEEIILVFTRR